MWNFAYLSSYLASLIALYLIAHFSVILIYRIFFHPLARYPGPFLAKLTSLYAAYHGYKQDIHLDVYACHKQYGDFVRYGPNSLLINTATGVQDIYGLKSNTKKGAFYSILNRYQAHSIVSAIDKDEHAPKRKLISPAFSESALKQYEPTIATLTDVFIDKMVGTYVSETQLIKRDDGWSAERNMSLWMDYLTFDIMTHLVFSSPKNLMSSPEGRSITHLIESRMYWLGFFGQAPWLVSLKVDEMLFPALMKGSKLFREACNNISGPRIRLQKELGREETQKDILGYMMQSEEPMSVNPPWTQTLAGDAAVLLVAGTDTSATALASLFFYVSRHPAVHAALIKEIRTTFSKTDAILSGPELNSCTYLHACISECLRIAPPFPSPLWREVKDGGMVTDTHVIPTGTNVATGAYALHHNSSYFPDPFSFRPERWIPSHDNPPKNIELAKSAFIPFSVGPRACVGKSLALRELSIAVARIVWSLDFKLADGEMAKLGEGRAGMGKGRHREDEFQLRGNFTAGKDGPGVQFRPRRDI